MVRKFEDHPYAQAQVIENDKDNMTLVSYETEVAQLKNGWLSVSFIRTATTRKHIGWFMRELGFTYQLAKQLYNDDKKFNIHTGEVQDNDY